MLVHPNGDIFQPGRLGLSLSGQLGRAIDAFQCFADNVTLLNEGHKQGGMWEFCRPD
jgi:hypothetical protein